MLVHVHVDPAWLRAHPWVGVLIGLAGVALMGGVTVAFGLEYLRMGKLDQPVSVTVATASLSDSEPRRWVELSGGTWQWDEAVETPRRPPESWLFGRVENTQVPIASPGGGHFLIAKFDGAVADHAVVAAKPVRGMLVREGDHVWGGGVAMEFRAGAGQEKRLVLMVGEGPGAARNYMLGGGCFLAVFLAFSGYYVCLWCRH